MVTKKKIKKINRNALGLDLLDWHFLPPKNQQEFKKYFDTLSFLNISWARVLFDWYSFRKKKNKYFLSMNRFIGTLKKRKVNILGVICNIVPGSLLNIIAPNKNYYLPPIDYKDNFLDFTKKTVSYYKKDIKHWEFINEPDTRRHWIYKQNAADYIDMLKDAYLIIKKIDTKLKVLSGGMVEEGLNLDPNASFHTPYLKDLVKFNLGDYCDIVGIHVWPLSSYIGLNFGPSFYVDQIVKKTKTMVDILKKGKIKHDVWITETGINQRWSLLNGEKISLSYSLLLKKLVVLDSIKKIFIFCFRDFPNDNYEFFNPDPYFGLVTEDYKIKKSAKFLIKGK